MFILGISAFYHDSAACLVKDGKILSAAQEERFTRKKHDWEFPKNAVRYCLRQAGISAKDLDLVVFYDKPFLKFERILETHLHVAPKGIRAFLQAMPVWIKQKIWVKEVIRDEVAGFEGKILFPSHHESHAASAFFPSPFEKAAFLTVDGVGEWTTTSFGTGEGNRVRILADISFPHSLGLLYSAFTYYAGFKVNSGEYKLMGLAPYGEAKYADIIREKIIDVKEDGSFRLDMQYFDYCAGQRMTNKKFHELFGGPPRKPESLITQKEMDVAKSVQEVLEEVMLRICRTVKNRTGMKHLCLAGGVALNCVANGRILREKIFDDIWIQPASGDAGGALGAALYAWYQYAQKPRSVEAGRDSQQGSLLGPEYTRADLEVFFKNNNIPYKELSEELLAQTTADYIAQEKVVGWFQGRMEFGPRALGARSIIGDARSPRLQELMNLKIKFRESFRPFAPSVLAEQVPEYFDLDRQSPYMMIVSPVKESRRRRMTEEEQKLFGIDKLNVMRSDIPAVTHVDYSARVQSVDKADHPVYHRMISELQKRHGTGVIINTSFNVRGEPIVQAPGDAYRCFMRTNMDFLIMGNFVLDKTEQPPPPQDGKWMKEFELD